jgi:hypothetical protein
MPPIEARLGGLGFFGHAALGGVGAVMIHQTRTSGLVPLADEVRELEQAAGTIGIQAAYAVSVRDRNPLVYGDGEPVLADMPGPSRATIEALFRAPAVDPAAHVAMVEAIAAAVERPGFSVQFGPNGVQWCSDAARRHRGELRRGPGGACYAPPGDEVSRLGRPDLSGRHRRHLGRLGRCRRG